MDNDVVAVLFEEPLPIEIEAFLQQRRIAGADRFDEVWNGVIHVAPARTGAHDDLLCQIMILIDETARDRGLIAGAGGFNLGTPNDYRIPDGGLRRESRALSFYGTAALVVEICSTAQQARAKLPFYANHKVAEVIIVELENQSIHWLQLQHGRYESIERSDLITLGLAELALQVIWPPPTP